MRRLEENQKVFGIGLSKTGTTSLTKALNIVGIHTIHYPWDQKTFDELQRGEYRLSVLNEYQGVTDTPVAPFFAQLDKAWPGSKFILTVREKGSWLRSAENHWKTIKEGRRANDKHFQNFTDFVNACVYGCVYFNAERFSYAYDNHIVRVREYFEGRSDDLLVLDICGGKAGWADLSHFLGHASPTNLSFPHEYRTHSDRLLLRAAKRELAAITPERETIIVIDQEELGEDLTAGRHRLPFLEKSGIYWGNPTNDVVAVRELERLRTESGATFLAIAWPGFWWLGHYQEFAAYLEATYRCTLKNERLIVFDLKSRRA